MENQLTGKKIIVGITGSIAAYKSLLLIRELVKKGAGVHVVLTPSAVNFVAPMTIANLTRNKVLIDMFDESSQSGGAWHIELVHSCDMMLIAPCSASTLGKIANGICDNALATLAVALPSETPLLIAPAMDYSMLMNPSTQRNIELLASDGAVIIPPAEGELSSGLIGPGRLPETEVLLEYVINSLIKKKTTQSELINKTDKKEKINEIIEKPAFSLQDAVDRDKWTAELEFTKLKQKMNLEKDINLSGKKILISAGPTIEKIDSVRFISNHSSGKMGFALAEAAKAIGADVTVISGPVELSLSADINLINVISADEMFNEVVRHFKDADIAIMTAAVADFTPKFSYYEKIKKDKIGENWTIELIKTKDILAEIGKLKTEKQKIVGFALETANEIENGWNKMKEKNCNMVVVNTANKPNSGFKGDNNTITILTDDGKQETLPTMSKLLCAYEILKRINF